METSHHVELKCGAAVISGQNRGKVSRTLLVKLIAEYHSFTSTRCFDPQHNTPHKANRNNRKPCSEQGLRSGTAPAPGEGEAGEGEAGVGAGGKARRTVRVVAVCGGILV